MQRFLSDYLTFYISLYTYITTVKDFYPYHRLLVEGLSLVGNERRLSFHL